MNFEMMRLAKLAGLRKEEGTDREYMGDFDWRLFGDLIVANCAAVADHSNVNGKSIIGERIREHFGSW